MNVRGYNKTKAASHSQMPSVGSVVHVFTVKKTTQEICNSQNKNETNMTITFIIKHDKSTSYCFSQQT